MSQHPSRHLPPGSTRFLSLLRAPAIGVAAALLSACQPAVQEAQAEEAAASALMEAPVARVVRSEVGVGWTHIARVEAAERVDLQARVAGVVEAVLFREGDVVRAGQPLFQIDPRPFDAAVAQARAGVLLARAQEQLAASEAARARQMHADQAMATEEMERRVAGHDEAQARRAAAEAALQAALLNREFTQVKAPITGRIGRALVTKGNFVTAGTNATPLASIVATTPVHIHFDVSDRTVLSQVAADRRLRGWSVQVLDADGHPMPGTVPVDFTDHSIESATGTLRLRARIEASSAALLPGQYVRVRLMNPRQEPALLVPDQAIGTDQGHRYVLVVNDEGRVEYRAVTLGALHHPHRIVTSGLRAGEQVIVSGLMRVRPGMTVSPKPVDASSAGAPPATPAGS